MTQGRVIREIISSWPPIDVISDPPAIRSLEIRTHDDDDDDDSTITLTSYIGALYRRRVTEASVENRLDCRLWVCMWSADDDD